MTKDTHASDWSNYWQGRTAGEAGAALVGAGVETDTELAAFWADVFEGLAPETRVLDMACGAGSALRAAHGAGLTELTGADISPDAVTSLKAAIPGAEGHVTGADKTSFPDGAFDLVVSQFGFEYAGWQAATPEMIRLIAPGGQFTAIAHLAGGAIEAEVRDKLDECIELDGAGFIPVAETMFTALFAADADPEAAEKQEALKTAIARFQSAEQKLASLAATQGGQAKHLHDGARALYQRRQAYKLEDVLGWLSGMSAEIAAYHGRMKSMTDAALSEDDAVALMALFTSAGFTAEPLTKLKLDGEAAAWVLKAQRS